MNIHLLCLVVALVLFVLGAIGIGGRVNLVSAGLAFLTASFLV